MYVPDEQKEFYNEILMWPAQVGDNIERDVDVNFEKVARIKLFYYFFCTKTVFFIIFV